MSIKDSAAKVKMLPGKPDAQKIIYLLETTFKAPMDIMNGDPPVGMVLTDVRLDNVVSASYTSAPERPPSASSTGAISANYRTAE